MVGVLLLLCVVAEIGRSKRQVLCLPLRRIGREKGVHAVCAQPLVEVLHGVRIGLRPLLNALIGQLLLKAAQVAIRLLIQPTKQSVLRLLPHGVEIAHGGLQLRAVNRLRQ